MCNRQLIDGSRWRKIAQGNMRMSQPADVDLICEIVQIAIAAQQFHKQRNSGYRRLHGAAISQLRLELG